MSLKLFWTKVKYRKIYKQKKNYYKQNNYQKIILIIIITRLVDLRRNWEISSSILYNQSNNQINQMNINKSYSQKFKFLKTNMN